MTAKKKVVSEAAKVFVTKTVGGVPSSEETLIEVKKFITEPAKVTAGYGMTLNLGNYESARVDVGVTLPCYVEEIDEAYKEAVRLADEWIDAQVSKIKGTGGSTTQPAVTKNSKLY